MANPKRTSHTGPFAERPHSPDLNYGTPKSTTGLLPWAYVSERMTAAKCYWVSTVGPNARPHATPVDGLWLDDRLYFGGSPTTRRNRNLATNPYVCVHLENGLEVVILHGEAQLAPIAHEIATRLAEAHAQKYGYGFTAESFEAGGTHVFRPQVVFAWKQFPKDVTRWRF